jgi:uncharacterized membrane protein YdjX (TVP38/TMEM64 family)
MTWRQLVSRLGSLGVLGLLWLALPGLLGLYLVVRLADVAALVASYKLLGLGLWTVAMAVAIGIGLLPVYSNTIICGWVFGWLAGGSSAIVSYLGAALIGFFLSQRFSQDRVQALIDESPAARRIHRALLHHNRRRSLLIITLWRLSGSPFPFTNLVMTSCGVPLGIYLVGTLFGLLPRVIIGTLVSATAARTGAKSIQALVLDTQQPGLLALGVVGSLLVLATVGQIARLALRRATAESAEP